MTATRRSAASGFTLIEVLVALLVFSIVAGLGYRGLGAVLDAGERITGETRKWRELALAFEQMRQSFTQVADRPIRDRHDAALPAFVGVAAARNESEPLVSFTRMGYAGYAGAAADQQRVAYRVRGGRIEQLSWPVLDQAPNTKAQAATLLEGVRDVSFAYLHAGFWHAAWPIAAAEAQHPAAVSVTVSLENGERYRRTFALP